MRGLRKLAESRRIRGSVRRAILPTLVLIAGLCLAVRPLFACGPFFPNQVLIEPDKRVLEAPVGTFAREIERIPLCPPAHLAVVKKGSPESSVAEADVQDLSAALAEHGISGAALERTMEALKSFRQARVGYAEALRRWEWATACSWGDRKPKRPDPPEQAVPPGLPLEFNEYLQGAVAYYDGKRSEARRHWEAVLALPAAERRYRSMWAAFMIGKSWLEEDPAQAVEWFIRVRRLVSEGFADRLGLAAESIGWEGRAEMNRRRYEAAIERYLAQQAAGDPTACLSVRCAVRELLQCDAAARKHAAGNPLVQRAVTAYLVSGWAADRKAVEQWLAAVESAGLSDVGDADRLAAIAYRAGDFKIAWRWVDRADERSPLTRWLRCKLLLREGKVDEAACLLSTVVVAFPADASWRALRKDPNDYLSDREISFAADKPSGELGVLRLAHQQYVEALDVLLRGGYWLDGAYVAESVLSADELKAYVDRCWPEPAALPATGVDWASFGFVDVQRAPEKMRHLLARRLVRLGRYDEAGAYFPARLRKKFGTFVEAVRKGADQRLAAGERAEAEWEAARIARHAGIDLMGTEMEPDWAVFEGQFDPMDPSVARARAAAGSGLAAASVQERRRIQAHGKEVAPDRRFHYRYRAAELAWQAAALMPDNTLEKAEVLCEAGSWLKYRDPAAANRFYKALVEHCGETPHGKAAARLHWFPESGASPKRERGALQ